MPRPFRFGTDIELILLVGVYKKLLQYLIVLR